MKYKKIKVIGIGLISIFCMFMINVQNVSADGAKAYVEAETIRYSGRTSYSFSARTTCDKWMGKKAPACQLGTKNFITHGIENR